MNLVAEQPIDAPLVVLDGMSLAFRAFFALSPEIATSNGVTTNALHGFAAMLHSLVRTQHPRALAVAFDLPGGTFRDAMSEDYKGGRAATPPELEPQFGFIRSLCEALHIPVLAVPGFEADDVLATLATWGREHRVPVTVVTGDRDTFQLVEDPYVKVLYNRRGVSDYSLYDEAGIVERCGVEPARYPLLAALRGDPSDNLPGVPGVGEKTAAKLLAQYRDFDEIYQHLDELTPKLRENLAAFEERARNNERVMRLVRDVPLDFTFEELTLGGWNHADALAFFDRFEMKAMRSRFDQLMSDGLLGEGDESGAGAPVVRVPAAVTWTDAPADEVMGAASLVVAFDDHSVAVGDRARGTAAVLSVDEFFERYRGQLIAGHDVKGLLRRAADRAVATPNPIDDTAIMAFLVDSVSGRYALDDLTQRYLGVTSAPAAPTLFTETDGANLRGDLARITQLIEVLREEIVTWELGYVYESIELPLVAVLARMESRGVRVDVALLRRILQEFTAEAALLDASIQDVVGHPFKMNSPQQLQTVLFDELGLTAVRKIKTGYSTDASSLEAIIDEHRVVAMILRYREVEKLRSTYGATLIDSVGSDGRIHAVFQQTVARTGRLSSENPNLHNIPVRSDEGRRLRYAFVPAEGWLLAVADYNQIELRILAHLSQDEGLLGAFAAGEDVHRAIASSVFGVEPSEITHEQREQAKAVSYGLAYGMEAFGLSQRLGITVANARAIMDRYFDGFPTLRHYMDETVREIRERGYSRTELGRIRPFPDLATATGPQRQAAERQAMNAGIQGLAADVFKSALVRLDDLLRDGGYEARLILQVHDEVLVEAPHEEQTAVGAVITDALTNAATLTVPLDVTLRWGENWAQAKG